MASIPSTQISPFIPKQTSYISQKMGSQDKQQRNFAQNILFSSSSSLTPHSKQDGNEIGFKSLKHSIRPSELRESQCEPFGNGQQTTTSANENPF